MTTTPTPQPRVVRPVRTQPVRTTLVLPAALHRRLRMHLINDEIDGGANQLIVSLIEEYLDGLDPATGDRIITTEPRYMDGYRAAMAAVQALVEETLPPTPAPAAPAPQPGTPVTPVYGHTAPPVPATRPGLPTAPPPPRS